MRTLVLVTALAIAAPAAIAGIPEDGVVVVSRGQSVSELARRHRVTVDQIRSWNALKSVDSIAIGQRLHIAPPQSDVALANVPPTPGGLGGLLWRVIKWAFGALASLMGLRFLRAIFAKPSWENRVSAPVPTYAPLPVSRAEPEHRSSLTPKTETFVKERRLIVSPDGTRTAIEVTVLCKVYSDQPEPARYGSLDNT